MRLLFVADGRSPTAINWMRYFVDRGDHVHLVSLFPCSPKIKLASLKVIPVAFSGYAAYQRTRLSKNSSTEERNTSGGIWTSIFSPQLRTNLRHWLVPKSLPEASMKLMDYITNINPDVVHAMRIPYEGMVTALVNPEQPFVLSTWGNDFSLHAPSNRMMGQLTEIALARADVLHTDCHKDLRLAKLWGYQGEKHLVLPGSGGVKLSDFSPEGRTKETEEIVIINPRGLRAYVRNDVFFEAVSLVAKKYKHLRVICPGMKNSSLVNKWLHQFSIVDKVDLLPLLPHSKMAALYRKASIVVSPSTHDGTPNSLLEAMASGCFPIVGEIESIREWITPGVNGLLVDPNDANDLANQIIEAIENPDLRERAADINLQIIKERASYSLGMEKVAELYDSLVGSN